MPRTVFFDLDGTLTDPKTGITTSIQYALRKLSADVPSNDDLTWCIGPPLLRSFSILVGDERAALALEYYRERFSDIGWRENLLYPGMLDVLARLHDQEFRLYVATSKPHVYANRIIEYFQMDEYFGTVYGSELDGTRADKSELLRYALSEVKPTEKATMVGDREHDVVGALANDMAMIGVTYGYGSREELVQAGANKIANTPEELLAALQ